jgi:purine-binding chemotaxis protein CheW
MVTEQMIIFQLGKDEYAVPLSNAKHIIHYRKSIRTPNAPDYIKWISFSGRAIPVIELAIKLNLTVKKYRSPNAIVFAAGGMEVAIAVDHVSRIMPLRLNAIETLPATIGNKFLRGLLKDKGGLLILLDIDEIFRQEKQSLQYVARDKYDSKYWPAAVDMRTSFSLQ